MAYNASNDIIVTLGQFDKNLKGDKVAVTKITNKSNGNVAYDIRNLFTTENDELKPTSKGIRLNSELVVDVLSALIKGLGEEERIDLMNQLETLDSDDAEDDVDEEDDEDYDEEMEDQDY